VNPRGPIAVAARAEFGPNWVRMHEQGTLRGRVFVVDDEPDVLDAVTRILRRGGFQAQTFSSVARALTAVEGTDEVDVVLTDLHLPGMTGLDLLTSVKGTRPGLSVVVMTGKATISAAVEAMRKGAFDFVTKPVPSPDELCATVQRAVDHTRLIARNAFLERQVELSRRLEGVVAASPSMRETMQFVESVAATDSTVLIRGESGTGKEVIARAVHEMSSRKHRPFVGVNCGALTEALLESELFGHVRGAFTGAVAARRGLFEQANGGTIFLDEIGELSPTMQVKLLRVLEEREVRPVGDSQARPIDVRVLAATHRDLEGAIRSGSFRQDLFYSINVLAVPVAPLRERHEDILPLAHHFIRTHAERAGKVVTGMTPEVAERLERYSWPGNVRELSNCAERAVVLARDEILGVDALPLEVRDASSASGIHLWAPSPSKVESFSAARSSFETNYLTALLGQAQGNLSVAAEVSGIDRSNLRRMLKRCGISADDFRPA
jgi:DNA-binding NtrC family response regulator